MEGPQKPARIFHAQTSGGEAGCAFIMMIVPSIEQQAGIHGRVASWAAADGATEEVATGADARKRASSF